MKNVDLVFGYLIQSPNGVSSVVRLFLDHKHLFEKYGVNCNFHIRGNYVPGSKVPVENTQSTVDKSLKSKLKQTVKNLIDSSTKVIPTLHSAYSIYNILMIPAIRVAKTYVANEDPDSTDPLFFHDLFACYFYLRYTKAKKRPVLLVIHTNGETYNMLKMSYPNVPGSWVMKWLNKIERFTLSRVSHFGFVAKNAMDHFNELHPELTNAKLHYVHNGLPGVSLSKCPMPENNEPFRLVCVGSVSLRKGQDIIIETLCRMSPEKRNKIHVTFVGDGAIRNELEEKCLKNNLTNCVTFVGSRNDVDRFLSQSHIFILTSRDEGFPMSILEAERAGLPIISTKVAGIPEMIVNNQTGLLINPCYEDLLNIFNNIDTYNWEEMGKQSKALFNEKFAIENTIRNYCSIFKEMQ